MKLHRSTINRAIDQALTVTSHFGIALPPWARWTPSQWAEVALDQAYDEIRDCMLGWDVTDFGSDDFENLGRVLFTLRNGRHEEARYPKPYAEKLLIDPENQRAPAHFHRSKREDIIGLAGGNILVQLEPAGDDEKRSGQSMTIKVDGITRESPPAGIVRLEPGMSLTIPPRTIHQFWAEEGTGWPHDGKRWSLSREISSVCDDRNDNFFIDVPGIRFPEIVENEPPRFTLCHEYPRQ
jgi:D-lyxose ketol-isomerase